MAITLEQLLSYPDGTWILTDRSATKILHTACADEGNPRIKGDILEGLWWRRKQLMELLWPSKEVGNGTNEGL